MADAAESSDATVSAEAPTAESNREETVVSLLDRLRSPAPSDLSRKRKIAVNTPGNRRSVCSKKANEPVKVTASQRVLEFKDEGFVVSQGSALFCKVCREEISLKKQNITVHVSSKKHKSNKEKMEGKTQRKNSTLLMPWLTTTRCIIQKARHYRLTPEYSESK